MYKIIFILTVSYLLTACGGGGGSTNDGSTNGTTPQTQTEVNGKVELGPISGGNVIIKSLDGYELASYTTDTNGNYTINIKELKEAIRTYNSSMKFVRIISYGGIDTDVDDDGTHKQKLVQGSISGIVPIDRLFRTKGHHINLISTAIDKLLADSLNISEEEILKIARELKISDVDKDGNITIDDILDYQMSKNESIAEDELRSYLLPTIHDNNLTEQNNVIANIQYEHSTIVPKIEINSNVATVSFSNTPNNYIQYAIKNDASNVEFQKYYLGNSIDLYEYDVLFFQKCNISYGCSKIQKLYFDGKKTFLDYLEMPNSDMVNKIKEYEIKKKKLEDELKELRALRDK